MQSDVQDSVIPYDLTLQDRIIRGRMPTLEIIHDRFVRMFRITLSGALRKPIDVSVRSTELIKFGEFLKKIPVPSSLNLFRLNPLRGTGIMVLESRLVFNLVDIFYGGTGELEVKAVGRDYTPIEQRLIKRVVISALEDLQTAWRPVFPTQISYQRTEINPQFVAIVPQSEVVVVITFDVEMGGMPMTLSICIPYSMIEPIRRSLDSGFQPNYGEANDPWSERFVRNLAKVKVPLVAKTDCCPITIRDFVNLKEGDFLLSDKRRDQPLNVYINGVKKMTGMMQENKGRQTVEIEQVFEARSNNEITELHKEAEELSRIRQRSAEAESAQVPSSSAEPSAPQEESPLATLKWLEPKMVADHIRSEHPQTIAVILAHLEEPEQSALVLKELPQQLHADVTYRMAIMGPIPPGVIKEIEEVLSRELKTAGARPTLVAGIDSVAAMLNTMDKTTESQILATIEDSNPDLAEQIRELMFTFEDLILLDPIGMQAVLKEIPQNELVLSLKTASDAVKSHIFSNLSEQASGMIQDDLDALGPVRVEDVDLAQQKIVKIARKLEEEGEIIISGASGDSIV